MLGITHVAIGAAFGVLVATTTDEPLTLSEWGFLLIGSLAPDVDQGNALISRPGSLLFRFLPRGPRVFLDVIGLAVSKLLSTLFGHRNFIHRPVLGMSFIGCGILSGLHPLIWFGWGYLLHIVADACTSGGAPLLGPFSRRRFCLIPLRTGSWQEFGLAVGLWAYTAVAGNALLPAITREWLGRYASLLTR